MVQADAENFVAWVMKSTLIKPGSVIEFAIVCLGVPNFSAPNWLSFGSIQGHKAAWLAGTEPGNLFIPESELEVHSNLVFLTAKALQESYEYLGVDNGVEKYRHKETGEHIYVGRTGGLAQGETTQEAVAEQAPSIESTPLSPAPRWWQFWK